MTYTINEHLTNSSIAEDDIFMVFGIPNNKIDNLQLIGRWFKRNPETHFKYIRGSLKNTSSKLNLQLLKTLYPKVRFITAIDNPWCRIYHIHHVHPVFNKISLKNFVKLISSLPSYCVNLLDLYPPDKSIIFLRNEYIETDFIKFSKSSNAVFTLPETINYRRLFDKESNDLIRLIYQKDLSFFYPELLS